VNQYRYSLFFVFLFALSCVRHLLFLTPTAFPSDSSVFQLPEGRMLSYFGIVPHDSLLDVPNAALGVLYYLFWLLLSPLFPKEITFVVASLAMSSSVFLAIKLLILKELCILCWSTHLINSRLVWSAFSSLKATPASPKKVD
jgi:hypothetical protein